MPKKFYTAAKDIIFKKVICTPPYNYLKKIIEQSLEKTIKPVISVQTSNEDLYHSYKTKNKILDVLVKTEDETINIEINTNADEITKIRNFTYLANIYSTHTKRGEKYDKNRKFIQINLSWNLSQEHKLKTTYEIKDINGQTRFIKNFKIIEINSYYLRIFQKDNIVTTLINI